MLSEIIVISFLLLRYDGESRWFGCLYAPYLLTPPDNPPIHNRDIFLTLPCSQATELITRTKPSRLQHQDPACSGGSAPLLMTCEDNRSGAKQRKRRLCCLAVGAAEGGYPSGECLLPTALTDALGQILNWQKHREHTLPNIFRLLTCVRVIGLETLLPASQRDTQTEQDRDCFLEMRHRYLADGTFTPISEMVSMLAYSKHTGLTASNSGNVYWSEDKDMFYLNSQPILVSHFCKMAQDLVAEASEMLWGLCWAGDATERITIDLWRVVDNVALTKRSVSFVNALGNNLADGLAWMLSRAATTEGRLRLKRADGRWDIKAVRRYMQQINRFLECYSAAC
jgi:hypothetical protein